MLDFSDHRVIGITIGISIAIVSLLAIIIRYFIHRKKS